MASSTVHSGRRTRRRDDGHIIITAKILVFKSWAPNTLLVSPGVWQGGGVVRGMKEHDGALTFRSQVMHGLHVARFVVKGAFGLVYRYTRLRVVNNAPYLR